MTMNLDEDADKGGENARKLRYSRFCLFFCGTRNLPRKEEIMPMCVTKKILPLSILAIIILISIFAFLIQVLLFIYSTYLNMILFPYRGCQHQPDCGFGLILATVLKELNLNSRLNARESAEISPLLRTHTMATLIFTLRRIKSQTLALWTTDVFIATANQGTLMTSAMCHNPRELCSSQHSSIRLTKI